eukprot:352033-Chlamydomonas_euryale.AAC.8
MEGFHKCDCYSDARGWGKHRWRGSTSATVALMHGGRRTDRTGCCKCHRVKSILLARVAGALWWATIPLTSGTASGTATDAAAANFLPDAQAFSALSRTFRRCKTWCSRRSRLGSTAVEYGSPFERQKKADANRLTTNR